MVKKWFGNKQAQTSTFANTSMQQIAQTQNIIKQIDDTFETITTAAEMYQRRAVKEKTVNRMCDGTVLTLNMLAGTFEELYQEKDKHSILLAKKRAFDHFERLKSKDTKTYNLIEPHRNFINAALNGQKDLRYKSVRVRPDAKRLSEQDVAQMQKTWGKMIQYQQEYDHLNDSYLEPEKNKQLASGHQAQLAEICENDKYESIREQKKYNRPKQSDFYWTKSGKEAKFVDISKQKQDKEQKDAMDEDVYGDTPTAYDVIRKKANYMNTVIKFSSQKKWKYNKQSIKSPIPALIVSASQKDPDTKVKVHPCKPFDDVYLDIPVAMLDFDEGKIKKLENKFISRHKKLGYASIEEQEPDLDNDSYMR